MTQCFMEEAREKLPTASAIMGDVIGVCRNTAFGCNGRIGCTCYKDIPVKAMEDIESKYFVRTLLEDKPGTLAAVASTFSGNNASIDQMVTENKIPRICGSRIYYRYCKRTAFP